MNFLNPIFLFSLAAVSIPVLIHILSRRRIPEIPFSTIMFLRDSDRRSMRRVNMKRLLLLLLRMAVIALVCLAFARPVIKGGLAKLFPGGGRKAVCIAIDRSYSMAAENGQEKVFEEAKKRVVEIMETLEEGDELTILAFDTGTERILGGGRFELGPAVEMLDRFETSWRGTDIAGGVSDAFEIVRESRLEAREVFIVSDFQRSALSGSGATAASEPEGGAPKVRAFLVPVGTHEGANVSIERVLTPAAAIHRGETATIRILMRNYSGRGESRFPLRVEIDGKRIMEREVMAPPGGEIEEKIEFPVEKAGWIEGEVSKRADVLPPDDRRFFSFLAREKVDLLLIGGDEAFYLEQALSPGGAQGDLVVTRRGWREFASSDMESVSGIVLGPGKGPEGNDLELIRNFAERGGKVIVPVIRSLEEAAKRLSSHDLRISFPYASGGYLTVERPDVTPEILQPFDADDLDGLMRVRFYGTPDIGGVTDRGIILSFKGGKPFIWAEPCGGGTIVFAAFDPVPEGGDLVLSPYFLPLVQQLVFEAGRSVPSSGGALIGDPVTWRGVAGEGYSVKLPDGTVCLPERMEDGAVAGTGGADELMTAPAGEEPGFLSIYGGEDLVWRTGVNPLCGGESDLAPVTAEEASDSLALSDFTVVRRGDKIAEGVRSAREGKEISTVLIYAALILLVTELFVSQREGGEREG